MAVGESIVSAFSGIADSNSYNLNFDAPKEKTHKISYTKKELELHNLYKEVRNMREKKCINIEKIKKIHKNLVNNYPSEWLLVLEIYELLYKGQFNNLESIILKNLEHLSQQSSNSNLIKDGIEMIKSQNIIYN